MKLLFVLGTRPEAIKLAPLIRRAATHPETEPLLCSTGQHREMLDQVLGLFDLKPHIHLALMEPRQTLTGLGGKALLEVGKVVRETRPDWVIVQGDTATAFLAALAGFYEKSRVAHVEAGLRTHDLQSPFPEEANRQLISRIASLHFAPTQRAAATLKAEGIPEAAIHVTGNTGIDALLDVAATLDPATEERLIGEALGGPLPAERGLVLITAHRRESFGKPFEDLCEGIRRLATRFSSLDFVYPVHLNPEVQETVQRHLKGLSNVRLIAPVEYRTLVALMKRARLLLTDSGGIQEEAPSLGKPVLVLREKTERQEGVEAGVLELVGTDPDRIETRAAEILEREPSSEDSRKANPFGDGKASEQILKHLRTRAALP